jgi:hypothetical protein
MVFVFTGTILVYYRMADITCKRPFAAIQPDYDEDPVQYFFCFKLNGDVLVQKEAAV